MNPLLKQGPSLLALSIGISLPAAVSWADQDPFRLTRAQALVSEQDQPQVVTRVYSLRPLVQAANESLRDPINADVPALVPDISLLGRLYYQRTLTTPVVPGEAPVAPQPMDEAAAPPADKQVVPQLIEIIMTAVEPESWVDLGGSVGQIAYLRVNNSLVVTHTPAAQAKIADLLASIQDRRVVSTQARLVRVESPRIDASIRIEQGVSVFDGDVAGLPTVAEVRVSGFDGQAQLVKDGQSVPYYAQVMPVVADNAVGYQAQVAEIDTGLTLKVTPVLNQDGNQITLEVSAEYELVDKDDLPTTRPTADAAQAVLPDLIAVDRRSLALSLRVPAGRWVLVGSLGASRDGAASEAEPLHLLIRVDTGNINAGDQP
jgi:hypothetical protein